MNRGIAFAAVWSAVIWTSSAQAQQSDGWRVSGSMRLRYEAVDGQVRPGFDAANQLVDLRTTVFAEYRSGPFRLGGEIDDSRAWGGDKGTPISTNEVDVLEPVQAYVGLSAEGGPLGPVSVQAGRFFLNLGSRRLVSGDDYRNTISSYQGVRIDLAPAGVQTTLLYTQPVIRLPDGLANVLANRQQPDLASSALQLWGGIADKPGVFFGATVEATYFHLQERDSPGRPTRDRALDTFGGRLILDPKALKWDYEIEALMQTGSVSKGLGATDPKLGVQAGFLHAGLGYTWGGPWAPHLSVLFDLVTGNRGATHYNRFDTLFGMRRSDYAPAGIYNAIGRANMTTAGLRLDLAPKGPWDTFVAVRPMWLQSATDAFSTTSVQDLTGRSGDYAGTQLDGRVRYWLVKDRLRAEADGVLLFKGRFLTTAPNAPHTGPQERYGSLNLTALF